MGMPIIIISLGLVAVLAFGAITAWQLVRSLKAPEPRGPRPRQSQRSPTVRPPDGLWKWYLGGAIILLVFAVTVILLYALRG